ncbi:MAG: HAD family hydrolase [Ruminococcus sp.]|nr:HAD family hydrolase [Ruminococcus sp.]
MYKLVIFDLDGTLVNSLADLGNSCNSALAEEGFPVHAVDEYRYMVGNGVPALIRAALPERLRSEENISRVKDRFDRIYGENFDKFTRPYDGMEKLLADLSGKGIMTAVASNKPDIFTKQIVKAMFGEAFSYVSGKKDGVPKKPDPQLAFHIMEKLGALPSETLFAGDSSVDMKTAENAGIDSIGCTWGFRTLEELKEGKAVYIADKPEDILSAALSR